MIRFSEVGSFMDLSGAGITLVACSRCGAVIVPRTYDAHIEWHERLTDAVRAKLKGVEDGRTGMATERPDRPETGAGGSEDE